MNVTIKGLPDEVGALLKERAAARGRSLNRDIIQILTEVAQETERRKAMRATRAGLDRFRNSLPLMSSSVPLIRADRESH